MGTTAEIFSDQGRQAVRLPENIHFSGKHVLVRQDVETGDIILSEPRAAVCNENFAAFLKLRDEIGPAEEDFLADRNREVPISRDLF